MQMFITFKGDTNNKAGDLLTFLAHCFSAEIREGSVNRQKGWIFIFKDSMRPFSFGAKRKYSMEDENAVANEIRSGKSIRQVSREKNISPTTVHTLYKRYLSRHPEMDPFTSKSIREDTTIPDETWDTSQDGD